MTAATRALRNLTDEQLVEMPARSQDSDSVELKVTVPDSNRRDAVGALQVAGEARAPLTSNGIDLTGEQRTKTKTALEFFSREIADAKA